MGSEVDIEVRHATPKRIKELQFGLCTPQNIVKQGVVEVCRRSIYDLTSGDGKSRAITRHGPLDPRMGTSNNSGQCETCRLNLKHCNGHFGYIKLALPAFHIGFLKKTIEVLHCICKDCGRVLLNGRIQREKLNVMRRSTRDNMEHKKAIKTVIAECRKVKDCPHCHSTNGTIKKVPGHALKLIHDKFRRYNQSTAKKKTPPGDKITYDETFQEAKKSNPEVEKHFKKAMDDLNPLRVLRLFQKMTPPDCELLGLHHDQSPPEALLWQYVPTPPVSIRPSVAQDGSTNEDDLTNKLGDIIEMSTAIKCALEKGKPISNIMEQWDFMQLQLAMYVNSDVPNLQQSGFKKPIRGVCQRLKGKQGRFRGNLSGKRVDFSGRTVISPDPNLGVDEVAIPQRVAKNLTYPEAVTEMNRESLMKRVLRGPYRYPGANSVEKCDSNFSISLHALAKNNRLERPAANLKPGDIVHRHLIDGDIVLFNRQPSLHKLSILSHRVKVRHWRTFRLNECVCTPYNADFDGDEMNLHVPQTREASVEATELMGVKYNLATPKDGTPIIAATQDFITAAYLLSSKDQFYNRETFTQICCHMFEDIKPREHNRSHFDQHHVNLPEPTIWKPEALWTGKQVFNVLMRPTLQSKVLVNFNATCRQYTRIEGISDYNREDDNYLCVRNSEVMCGVMDKNILGDGKKDSVFYILLRDYGPDVAVQAMNRLAKLSARWLSNQGFSVGVNDVYPGRKVVKNKQDLILDAYSKADEIIAKFFDGELKRDAGCDEEQTMENKISGLLNDVRKKAGQLCFDELSSWNSPIIMAKCGSKGSPINVAQMVATVGQQIIENSRIADGFQDRTLPHFPKAARQPPSKGFVQNSFFSGLSPTEFLFHAMSGREGLVDTAVKTADTGYMSRRLMKSLEDLSSSYDDTVRNSSASIVQFQFGEDGLDPVDMEGKAKPVNLERTWLHAQNSEWRHDEVSLAPKEIEERAKTYLQKYKDQCTRRHVSSNEEMEYTDQSYDAIDQFESKRQFLKEVEEFVGARSDQLEKAGRFVQRASKSSKGSRGARYSIWHKAKKADSRVENDLKIMASNMAKVSVSQLQRFLDLCMYKYEKAKVEPGHAVGAVGAQSIGEPGTQMTLKTFHFAGVAGMSITQGVPRIKEIINGSKAISTPLIKCELSNKTSEQAARIVKSRIEKTFLKDVISYSGLCLKKDIRSIKIKLDTENINKLRLDISVGEILAALRNSRVLKLKDRKITYRGDVISIYPDQTNKNTADLFHLGKGKSVIDEKDIFLDFMRLYRLIAQVPVKGLPEATRAVIAKKPQKNQAGEEENQLMVEGYGFRDCLNTPGIDWKFTTTNSVSEIHNVLGIEAARTSIIKELNEVMGSQMEIDPRHMQLLADVMTYKGDVLGITRFGLAKMRDSVLQLASFEKTPDHLFEAAVRGQTDGIDGVSECIIMGQPMRVGTGAMRPIRPLGFSENDFGGRKALLEEYCRE